MDFVVIVEDSSNQNRQRECAKEDKKYSSCDQDRGVRLTQELTFLEEKVGVVFDLLSFEMAQVRVAHPEGVHILLLKFLYSGKEVL